MKEVQQGEKMRKKLCNRCNIEKPLREFYTRGSWRRPLVKRIYRTKCKGCFIKDQAKYSVVYKKRFPKKQLARVKLRKAVKEGIIKKLPCEVCKNIESEAHHPDYNKPLMVKWLCREHHQIEHYPQILLQKYA